VEELAEVEQVYHNRIVEEEVEVVEEGDFSTDCRCNLLQSMEKAILGHRMEVREKAID
jgi:hypothetical protein